MTEQKPKNISQAHAILAQNIHIGTNGKLSTNVPDYQPTPLEWLAIEYLCEAWQFDCDIKPGTAAVKPSPTEVEIAAVAEISIWSHPTRKMILEIIARHNAPLHAKIAQQKAALVLAREAIEAIAEFPMPNHNDTDYNCVVCGASSKEGHSTDCKYVLALAAIKEALQ